MLAYMYVCMYLAFPKQAGRDDAEPQGLRGLLFFAKTRKKQKQKNKQAIYGSDHGLAAVVFTRTRQKSIWPPNALGLMDSAAEHAP